MHRKHVWRRWLGRGGLGAAALLTLTLPLLLMLTVAGCKRSSGVKEAPITGRPNDPPLEMPVHWPLDQRCIYRVEASTSALIPRRTTGKLIRAETTFGQDLAFLVTNDVAKPDARVVT